MSISSVGGSNPYAYTRPPYSGAGAAAPAGNDPALPAADKGAAGKKANSVEDEFLGYAHMSLADVIRMQYLGSKGLTEDDLKNMDPKERQKIEDQIREEIEKTVKRDTEKKAGGLVNITA
jgi:hypothetical protein